MNLPVEQLDFEWYSRMVMDLARERATNQRLYSALNEVFEWLEIEYPSTVDAKNNLRRRLEGLIR